MEWNEIKNEDIKDFLSMFGYFHDSCLKELMMWTEFSVDDNLAMAFGEGLDTKIRLLIQRQEKNPSAIELLFEGVCESHLDNYGFIYDANITFQDETFYWANHYDWKPNDADQDVTWIASKKIKWRDVSNWMGEKRRYVVESDR
ncbi:hypothetical protein FZW96_07920 [Bacillus sp. BGMRC 2118]|nr:hypothetical protein FZW96_07920 [Bacillus sp. BGMRC 2118]